MINRVVLVGRITKDPVLRKTASGVSVVAFTLAVNRRIKKEGQPDADFINCQAWQGVADVLHKYTKKGSLIGVEGRIQTRSYDDRSGKRVYVTEVVVDSVQFLEPKDSVSANANVSTNTYVPQNSYEPTYEPGAGTTPSYSNDFASSDTLDISSDDLPF